MPEKIESDIEKPNFFVIGAQKAGTTSLYYYLKEHSEVFLPSTKELNYFSNPNRGSVSKYLLFFKKSRGFKAIGEISPAYLHVSGTAKAIYEFNKEAKIIVILREPVSRAYSNYIHRFRVGKEPSKDFEKAIELRRGGNLESDYILKSLYLHQLNEYYDVFPKSNILVIQHNNLLEDLDAELVNTQNFLGLTKEKLSTNYSHNTSTVPKHSYLKPIIRFYSSTVAPYAKKIVSRKVLSFFKELITTKPNKLSLTVKKKLMNKYFLSDVKELEKLIDQDLREWYE